jgi:hypothetical protein
MTSKKDGKEEDNDLRGFQEFLESQKGDERFLPRPQASSGRKPEVNFNNLSFLTNDRERLMRTKVLLNEKVNFMTKFSQGETLLTQQRSDIEDLRTRIFQIADEEESSYRKSLHEIFDNFFKNT